VENTPSSCYPPKEKTIYEISLYFFRRHALTEEKYLELFKKYEELSEEEKKQAFHARAIDGYGE